MNLTQRFDLAALAKGKTKKPRIEMKPIGARLWFEAELNRIILQVLREYDALRPDIAEAATATRKAYTADAFTLNDAVRTLRSRFTQALGFAEPGIDSLFRGEARRHDEKWIDQVNRVIGVDLKAVVTSAQIEPAIQLATQANVALIKGLTDDVAKRVEVAIINLVSEGASNKAIAAELTKIAGFGKSRAKLIAIDQASSFNATLNQIRQREAGVTSYVWSTVRDKRVRPAHRAREGQTFRWDSPPSDGHPGRAVRCFKGSSKVDLANGCNKLWRRLYNGPLVTVVTSEGRLLEATPNHPVLTRRGWLPLHAVQQGDDLVQRTQGSAVLNENDHNFVTSFNDLFGALNAAQPAQAAEGSKFDFHGDGAEYHINVVVPNRDLLARADAALNQSIENFFLAWTVDDAGCLGLNTKGASESVRLGLSNPAHGRMSGFAELLALFRGEPSHPDVVSGRAASRLSAFLAQDPINDETSNTVTFRKAKDALAVSIARHDLVVRKIVPAIVHSANAAAIFPEALSGESTSEGSAIAAQQGGDLRDSLPSGNEFARVTEKTVSEFDGHVYNLETNTGWYYSDDFVAHNCRCVARPVLDLTEAPKRPSDRVRARTEGLRAVGSALGLNP